MFGAEQHEDNHEEATPRSKNRNPIIWMGAAVVLVAIAGLLALASNHHQQATVNQLTARESEMNAQVASLQSQLSAETERFNEMTAAQAAAEAKAQAAAVTKSTKTSAAKHVVRRPVVDPRWKQMQSRLDAQQKQLNDATNAISQTRSDLEGNISSTRDELNGSIAKTHEELVALEQRGERNYYEFDLPKNKQFQRTGPISLSLRKADTKHKHYNLALIVDDNQLEKKNVDLYEPIWLRDSDDPQPLEIVVNKIDKNHIHGYVSAAKYTQAQLTPASAPANTPASQTPTTSPAPAPSTAPQSY
ncbi:MAG TPA: hypothetical protein VJS43_13260 [Candidatus Acidoferrales bacterium]|nr:hypothetical protein [Candidatus Acidoferrales bacterium]